MHKRTSTLRSTSRFLLLNALHQKHSSPPRRSLAPLPTTTWSWTLQIRQNLRPVQTARAWKGLNLHLIWEHQGQSQRTHTAKLCSTKMILSYQVICRHRHKWPRISFDRVWVSVSPSPSMVKYSANTSFSASLGLCFCHLRGNEQGKKQSHIEWQQWIEVPRKTRQILQAFQRCRPRLASARCVC